MKKSVHGASRLAACWLALVCLVPAAASAEDLLFSFAPLHTGKSPSTASPGIEATFETISPGLVRLTISNLDLNPKERVDRLDFNLDPSLDSRQLAFTYESGAGDFYRPRILTGVNRFASPTGRYDIAFVFRAGCATDMRFGSDDSVTYDISGIPGLTAEDFDYASRKGSTTTDCFAAAHLEGAGRAAWQEVTRVLPVPEPGSGSLLATAWVLAFLARRRRQSWEGR